jgi:hypothetical protein
MKPYQDCSISPAKRQAAIDLCDHSGRPVATLRGDVLHKSVHGSVHMLRSPRAWAIDECLYRQAIALGATAFIVHDLDTGKDYWADVATFTAYGFPLDRGHGAQLALCLPRWRVCERDQDSEPQPEPERPMQLALAFGGAR